MVLETKHIKSIRLIVLHIISRNKCGLFKLKKNEFMHDVFFAGFRKFPFLQMFEILILLFHTSVDLNMETCGSCINSLNTHCTLCLSRPFSFLTVLIKLQPKLSLTLVTPPLLVLWKVYWKHISAFTILWIQKIKICAASNINFKYVFNEETTLRYCCSHFFSSQSI